MKTLLSFAALVLAISTITLPAEACFCQQVGTSFICPAPVPVPIVETQATQQEDTRNFGR
jgi:hypothetical protein